jgi:steroid 5-alpha reductase family enzyme
VTGLLPLWAAATLFLSLVMATAWAVQRRTGQAAWADAFWSLGLGAAGIGVALAGPEAGTSPRQWLVAVLIGLWGLRLGWHIAARAARGPEDARYARLRQEWGPDFQRRLFWFLQLQAGAAAFLAGTILLAAHRPAALGIQDLLAALLLLVAVAGETLADRQLAAFKADKRNHGQVADRGLWAWSRHPNYFFEWLSWCAWALFAIDVSGSWPWGWLALSGPAYIFWLLTRVSGIPLLEAHMRRTRPQAFERYARRTNAFFPGPPKRND